MAENTQRRLSWRRVDMQVSILSAVVAVTSAALIFFFGYTITYRDMIYTLVERVDSIYSFLSENLDTTTFVDINSEADMDKQSYIDMKNLFKNVKLSTGVQYLYTAKRADDGQFVYVIDGLDRTAHDFRCPGDTIEPEITSVLERALLGEKILPKDIVHTDWGDIFITYLPIYDKSNEVVGVIGIEFAASHQYDTYQMLRYVTPIVIVFICMLSIVFSVTFFRRISNPHYQDLANTDTPTQLKNRNAYELDIRNACAMHTAKDTCLLLVDLNGLKRVNDTMGHEFGDLYIRSMADALHEAANSNEVAYRIGGDEFVILMKNAHDKQPDEFAVRLRNAFKSHKPPQIPNASYAVGWGFCRDNAVEAVEAAYSCADTMMYKDKNKYYSCIEIGDL